MSVEVMEEEWLYSEEQVRALLEWVRGQEGVERSVYPFVCLVAEQALRPGEARGLRVSDVDVPVHGWGKLTVGSSRTARKFPSSRGWSSSCGSGSARPVCERKTCCFPAGADIRFRLPTTSGCGSGPRRLSCHGTSGTRGAWGSPFPSSARPAW